MAHEGSFDGLSEDYKSHEQRSSKSGREMILNIGNKPEVFVTDQTPTPIRLIRNCEEMGLFQDLQNVNPFEETFRKATEDIRSGSSNLEISSLSATSNNDDSLHTPHVVFPPIGEPAKSGSESIHHNSDVIIEPDEDPLCLTLDPEELSKSVVQLEASEDMQISHSETIGLEEKAPATIQFLLRMPNGKMVQLSSLPVEDVDSAQTSSKEIPIIKVDSSALKNTIGRASLSNAASFISHMSSESKSINSSQSLIVDIGRESVVHASLIKETNQGTSRTPSSQEIMDHSSKMSIAKQRLKQALMSNSCPAATPSTSSASLDNGSASNITIMSTTPKVVSIRRPSSTSDEGSNRGSDNSYMEEKRRRNRAAAMRCREKRKTWVKELERRANDMLRTNGQLQYEVSLLRDEVAQLKTLLLAHRDCPVTQALVQGPSVMAAGKSSSSTAPTSKGSSSKAHSRETLAQTLVIQNPSTTVKPVILLGDPPVKRRRLHPTNKPITSVGSVVSTSTVPQTYVISSLPNASSKTATVLSSSFVNVIPSVFMASSSSSCRSTNNGSQVIALSSVVPAISSFPSPHFGTVQKQPFILPKSDVEFPSQEDKTTYESKNAKMRTSSILSTNVIKVNPNVIERGHESYDSDVEIIDVSPDFP